MRNPLWVGTLAFFLCFSSACEKQDKDADIAAIKASFQEFVQLYNAGDFERIIPAYYAENAIQMPPNESIRSGKDAILLGYQKTRELNDEHIDSSVIEDVRVSGDLAVVRGIDTGTSTPRRGGEPVKYLLIWLTVLERQSDGAWKWIYEIWNDGPPPETAAPR